MAPFATIYTWPGNPRLLRTLAAAKINNLELASPGPPEFQFTVTNKTEEFRAKFPLGKVPALETNGDSPVRVTEAAAIAHFVADSGPARDQLLGATPAERAKIQEWIFHSEHEIFPPVVIAARVGRGIIPFNKEVDEANRASFGRIIQVAEQELSKHQWIAGTEQVSLADLTIATHLYWAFKFWLGEEDRKAIPKTVEWYKRVLETDGAKGVWPADEWKA